MRAFRRFLNIRDGSGSSEQPSKSAIASAIMFESSKRGSSDMDGDDWIASLWAWVTGLADACGVPVPVGEPTSEQLDSIVFAVVEKTPSLRASDGARLLAQ